MLRPDRQSMTIPVYKCHKQGRKKHDAQLPRVDVVHDLPEEQKVCPDHGVALMRLGEEKSEKLDSQPG
jgi:transposase